MDHWLSFSALILAALIGVSHGYVTLIQNRRNRDFCLQQTHTQMLIGLGHDRIIDRGMCYIDRGWVTQAEYENLIDYLWLPYSQMGGNGTAEKIIEQVKSLPIRQIDISSLSKGDFPLC